MVNLCKSHITALRKVRSTLGSWTTSMTGLAISSVLTNDDCKQINKARPHIDKAIEYLERCNQNLDAPTLRTLNTRLRNAGITNKEITKDKGVFYVLHICKNNVPVPLFQSEDIRDISDYIGNRWKGWK